MEGWREEEEGGREGGRRKWREGGREKREGDTYQSDTIAPYIRSLVIFGPQHHRIDPLRLHNTDVQR